MNEPKGLTLVVGCAACQSRFEVDEKDLRSLPIPKPYHRIVLCGACSLFYQHVALEVDNSRLDLDAIERALGKYLDYSCERDARILDLESYLGEDECLPADYIFNDGFDQHRSPADFYFEEIAICRRKGRIDHHVSN